MARNRETLPFFPSAGFTLIELSIVLVIVALIVGGVLTGRDLIQAAQIRSQITQLEKYRTATNTFLGKYGFLPGDVPAARAASFGFVVRSGVIGDGDGNGYIATCGGSGTLNVHGCEEQYFWNDLYSANLVEGVFNQPGGNWLQTGNPKDYWPQAKIGKGNFVLVYNDDTAHQFAVAVVTQIMTPLFTNPTITPLEAFSLDSKLDDGLPPSGTVQALATRRGVGFLMQIPHPGGDTDYTDCAIAGGALYATGAVTGGQSACNLKFRF